MSKIYTNIKEFQFEWRIDDFFFSNQEKGEALLSPIFVAETLHGTHWCLKLYPRGLKDERYLSCFLTRCDHKVELEEIDLIHKIEIINYNRVLQSRKSDKVTFRSEGVGGWTEFMKVDELWTAMEKSSIYGITVKCHMFAVKPDLTCVCNSTTSFNERYYYFKLKVDFKNNHIYKTEELVCTKLLKLYITVSAWNDDIDIHITKIEEGGVTSRVILADLAFLYVKTYNRKRKTSAHLFKPRNNECWKFPVFLRKSEIIAERQKYVQNDMLTLQCNFQVSDGIGYERIEGYNYRSITHHLPNNDSCAALHEDLQRMYLDHVQTDIKLQCENGSFQAHKSILSVRSPIFAAMFQQDMLENQTGVVDVLDVEATTLDSFLRFVYSGVVEVMDCEKASKMLVVAEKYQVISLKEECSSFLKSILTAENVCDVLVAAFMGREEDLMSAVVDFIATHAEIILHSEDWYQCVKENAILATETLCKISAKLGDSKKCSK